MQHTQCSDNNLQTGDNAPQFKPVTFLKRHRRSVGVAGDNGLLLSTNWADVRVHAVCLGLGDTDAAAVEPIVTPVTADVEPTTHTDRIIHNTSPLTPTVAI